jgi:hypothetical protein
MTAVPQVRLVDVPADLPHLEVAAAHRVVVVFGFALPARVWAVFQPRGSAGVIVLDVDAISGEGLDLVAVWRHELGHAIHWATDPLGYGSASRDEREAAAELFAVELAP